MIKRSYLITRIINIPIRAHITLLILLPILAMRFAPYFGSNGFFFGLLCAAGVFFCVALHELGHSWVAIRKGCHVREILLLPIGGIAKMTNIPSHPKDELLVAIAGPAVSGLLALLFHSLRDIFIQLGATPISKLFFILSAINLALCLFNLLPAFPMDGGRIFRAFLTPRLGLLKATALAVRIGRILAVAGGIYALYHGRIILILIAIFIYQAAGAEYRLVYAKEVQQDWFTVEQQVHANASPPPYAHTRQSLWNEWKTKANAFLNGLFKK